jgi:hypothetical protein
MMAEKLENATKEEEKISHLPCAGIILFRFYGYHLSLARPAIAGWGQHPGNFKTGFPPAAQRYVTFDFNLRLTKN